NQLDRRTRPPRCRNCLREGATGGNRGGPTAGAIPGMIAEYERAQILERSRRGKRHRARQGQINVLSGAPYGYRYVRKSDEAAARYEIIDAEADIVRMVYQSYIGAGMSIGAIT